MGVLEDLSVDFAPVTNEIMLDSFQYGLAEAVLEQLDEIGQSALEVMTSGGKSYIAAYIMKMYASTHRNGKIIWFAPKSAINNVKKKIFSKLAIRNRIEYIGYEELSRGNVELKGIENIKLIVFDECHKAYAKKTYENLVELVSSMEDADRLAMSATPVRYDGKSTFEVLVPKVKTPIQFDIKDAAAHDLLPNVVYVLANMNISDSDFRALDRFKGMIKNNGEAKELYNEILDSFSCFKFDLEKDLGELLISNGLINGSSGERHIAFFSSIDELRNMKTSIEKAFELAYPDCEINILEYHSGISEEENNKSFDLFVAQEPQANRVDVMLSVDKATESIHPERVRSVLLFRGTKSVRVYLQQMGRGLMLKQYHPEDLVIIDFADNVSLCDKEQTAEIGYNSINKKTGTNTDCIDTIDSIKKAIINQFGYKKGLTDGIKLLRIQEYIDKLNKLYNCLVVEELDRGIKRLKQAYDYILRKNTYYIESLNLYTIFDVVDTEVTDELIKPNQLWKKCANYEQFKHKLDCIRKSFKMYQDAFLSSDREIDPAVKKLFESLGHSAYLRSGNGNISKQMLEDIDYIKEDNLKYNSINGSPNTYAKHKLKEIRLSYARKMVPHNICIYAERNNIDLEMHNINIADISSLCDTEIDKLIVCKFKPIIKLLEHMHTDICNGSILPFDTWLSCTAKMNVAYRLYREYEMTCIIMSYIYSKYEYIIEANKLEQSEKENGAKVLSAVMKINQEELPNKIEEDYIFEHSKTIGMSNYEVMILGEFGIKASNYVAKVEDKTSFMLSYNRALDGNEEDIKNMLSFNRDAIDIKRSKLLNNNAFRQVKDSSKDIIGPEILLKKAKNMFSSTEDYKKLRKEICEALNNDSIQQIDIALAPFREYELKEAKEVLEMTDKEFEDCIENLALITPLNKIVTRCSQDNSCTKDIIRNIIKLQALKPELKSRLKQIADLIEA